MIAYNKKVLHMKGKETFPIRLKELKPALPLREVCNSIFASLIAALCWERCLKVLQKEGD